MWKNLFIIFILFAAGAALFWLAFAQAVDEPADFTFVNGEEPQSLDPAVMTGVPEGRIAMAIFEGLYSYHPETLDPVPGVAESCVISSDGLTYTFKLRENARWSNGDAVTASDFVYSWNRVLDPGTASEYATQLHYILNAKIINMYSGLIKLVKESLDLSAANIELDTAEIIEKVWIAREGDKRAESEIREDKLSRASAALDDLVSEGVLANWTWIDERNRVSAELEDGDVDRFLELGVEAKDDLTLLVRLKYRVPYFLSLTAFSTYFPVHRGTVEKYEKLGEAWTRPGRIVTNGPYKIQKHLFNEKVRLEKNPYYWEEIEDAPEIVDVLSIGNVNTAFNLYATGGADAVYQLPAPFIDELRKRSDFRSGVQLGTYYYRFNVTREPFNGENGKLVRRAFCSAINRNEIVEKVTRCGEKEADFFVPPIMEPYESPEGFRFDPTRAARLLAEAGYPEGKGFPIVKLLYNTNESHKKVAEVLQDQLRENLGIDIVLDNKEWKVYLDETSKLNYQIARAGWIGDYVDPNTFLSMWITDDGNNSTGWSNRLYDKLVLEYAPRVDAYLSTESGRNELLSATGDYDSLEPLFNFYDSCLDPDSSRTNVLAIRDVILREAERILVADEVPILPVYFYQVKMMVKPYVSGIIVNSRDIHPVKSIRIDSGAKTVWRRSEGDVQ